MNEWKFVLRPFQNIVNGTHEPWVTFKDTRPTAYIFVFNFYYDRPCLSF